MYRWFIEKNGVFASITEVSYIGFLKKNKKLLKVNAKSEDLKKREGVQHMI